MESQAHVRSLYRAILRELPQTARAAVKTAPSPLRASIRSHFVDSSAPASEHDALARRQETDQAIQYLKSQRMYLTLLERYNPGADMTEEERVRLTARRVGMDMPEHWYGKGEPGKFGVKFDKKKE